jgi:hypothetical protein
MRQKVMLFRPWIIVWITSCFLQSVTLAGATGSSLHQIQSVPDLREKWGIEIIGVHLAASGNMLDFRYKVVDGKKAAPLFDRNNKPYLTHQPSGKVLTVPRTAKVGPLRSSDKPKEGRTYWMYFGNLPKLVKAGDKVTVTIGEFKAENLIVE